MFFADTRMVFLFICCFSEMTIFFVSVLSLWAEVGHSAESDRAYKTAQVSLFALLCAPFLLLLRWSLALGPRFTEMLDLF